MQLGSIGKFLKVQLHLWKTGTEVWEEVINLVKVTMEDFIFKKVSPKIQNPRKKVIYTLIEQNSLVGTYRF